MVRVWGTIGFVVPAWIVELILLRGLEGEALNRGRAVVLLVAGVAEVLLAFYCLTLPRTPPQPHAAARFAPGAVLGLLRQRPFLVLVIACFLVGIAHNFFFTENSPYLNWFFQHHEIKGALEQRVSSLGQISEIGVMACLGLLIAGIGFKSTLALGIFAYLLRCLIFALVPLLDLPFGAGMTLVALGQALHGFCFGCFLAAAFIWVDRMAPADLRGSMQTFFGTFVFALGTMAGGAIAGRVERQYTVVDSAGHAVRDWTAIWLVPAGLMAVTLAAFLGLFPGREKKEVKPA
jgi:MFS family permease